MARSLLDTEKGRCYLCGKYGQTERHHIFGAANRNNSEKYGMTVYLCHDCHNEPPNGVHHNKAYRLYLQARAQIAFEKEHSHDFFMQTFGRDYIEYLKSEQGDSEVCELLMELLNG